MFKKWIVFYASSAKKELDRWVTCMRQNLYPTHQYFPYWIVIFVLHVLYINDTFKMTNSDSKLRDIFI